MSGNNICRNIKVEKEDLGTDAYMEGFWALGTNCSSMFRSAFLAYDTKVPECQWRAIDTFTINLIWLTFEL